MSKNDVLFIHFYGFTVQKQNGKDAVLFSVAKDLTLLADKASNIRITICKTAKRGGLFILLIRISLFRVILILGIRWTVVMSGKILPVKRTEIFVPFVSLQETDKQIQLLAFIF